MTDNRQTAPAMKLSASWTPGKAAAADAVAAIASGDSRLSGLTIIGGRIRLTMAVPADWTDPEYMTQVAAFFAGVKEDLAARGEIHQFDVSAGSARHEDIQPLPEDSGKEAAA